MRSCRTLWPRRRRALQHAGCSSWASVRARRRCGCWRSSAADQVAWLEEAGLAARAEQIRADLAVIVADLGV